MYQSILCFLLLTLSVCQYAPYQHTVNLAISNPQQKFGQIRIYWNNVQIMYLSSIQKDLANQNIWFHVKPQVGLNILTIARSNNSQAFFYLDKITFKNTSQTDLMINGDFQTTGGWVQPNLNIQNIQNYLSKVLILDSSCNTASQTFYFNSNYQIDKSKSQIATNQNSYIVSFDYTTRADMNLNDAVGHVSVNGNQVQLKLFDYKKYKFLKIFSGNQLGSNNITFYSINPHICSALIVDNIKISKVGTTSNLLGTDGMFSQPVVVCGYYGPGLFNWQKLDSMYDKRYWITEGGVISPNMYSSVFFVCRDVITHYF